METWAQYFENPTTLLHVLQIDRHCAAGNNSAVDRSPETAAEVFLQVLGPRDDWPSPGDLVAVAQRQRLILMKVVSDSDLISVAHSDVRNASWETNEG